MAIRSLARSSIRQTGRVNSALAGYESNYFHHLETVRLGGTAASVTFSNLSRYNDYQHLQLRIVSKGGPNRFGVQFNGDTGNNYAMHFLYGTGSSVASGNITSTNAITTNVGNNSNGDASSGASIVDILDPFESKNTTVRSLTGNQGRNLIVLYSGVWINTASLTSINIIHTEPSSGTGNWEAGCRFSLYGLKARA